MESIITYKSKAQSTDYFIYLLADFRCAAAGSLLTCPNTHLCHFTYPNTHTSSTCSNIYLFLPVL